MPLEVATTIKDLVPTNPVGSDPIAGSDDHIRLIKKVLTTCFPSIDGGVVGNSFQLGGWVPSGGIIAWSGLASAVPAGWSLCDGLNGTPNLNAKFLYGTSVDSEVGTTGGALSATSSTNGLHVHGVSNSGAHSHGGGTGGTSLTVSQMPSHNHSGVVGTGTSEANAGYFDLFDGGQGDTAITGTGFTGGAQAHNHTIGIDGTHNHVIIAGGDHTHTTDTVPPFYRLAFIMRNYPSA